MKKRASRKASKPPPAPAARLGQLGKARAAAVRPPGPLLYKVVELSTVDESALERAINEWVGKGWNLDGVQFAMREQSKRPSMAFVFFTREGAPEEQAPSRSEDEARTALSRLSEAELFAPPEVPVSAHERLRQLAGEDDEAPGQGE